MALTRAQQEYFKDSKIRDNDGRLQVVYHGTRDNFDSFANVRTEPGYWFTEDKDYAQSHGEKVLEVYLDVKNPFTLEDSERADRYYSEFLKEENPYECWDDKKILNNDFRDFLKEKGHDAMIWEHSGAKTIVVFEPNQIKAIDNRYPTKSDNFKDNGKEYLRDNFRKLTVQEHLELAKTIKLTTRDSGAREEFGLLERKGAFDER